VTWSEMLGDVQMYMNSFYLALEQIANAKDIKDPEILRSIARNALEREPTTADPYNTGDDIEYKWVSPNDPGDENDTSK
tara:strand:+ start:179 stop:415 length:237 start_codon:yes stop_codon:yes gene_type:complete